jgi:hypothetical protein
VSGVDRLLADDRQVLRRVDAEQARQILQHGGLLIATTWSGGSIRGARTGCPKPMMPTARR